MTMPDGRSDGDASRRRTASQMPAGNITDPCFFDLASGQPAAAAAADLELATDDDLPAAGAIAGCASIAVRFPVFSDGRGFTLGRRLRTESRFEGRIIATGHLIPDQADFLCRCGFSHVWIKPDQLGQWQRARASISARFQHMPSSPRRRA